MKRLLFLLLLPGLLLSSGCGAGTPEPSAPPAAFSYADVSAACREGGPGIYWDGFSNTDVSPVEDADGALERARTECTVDYDSTSVAYDEAAGLWQVVFFCSGVAGGDQSVYLDQDGVTRLIVYGE